MEWLEEGVSNLYQQHTRIPTTTTRLLIVVTLLDQDEVLFGLPQKDLHPEHKKHKNNALPERHADDLYRTCGACPSSMTFGNPNHDQTYHQSKEALAGEVMFLKKIVELELF